MIRLGLKNKKVNKIEVFKSPVIQNSRCWGGLALMGYANYSWPDWGEGYVTNNMLCYIGDGFWSSWKLLKKIFGE